MSVETHTASTKHKRLENLFQEHGYSDFKWIDPKKIIVSQWVRMKCTFGCNEYGKSCCCPPNVPPVPDCERFFHEYNTAAIFHFVKKVEQPEDRHDWSKEVNMKLLKLERAVFLSGFERTFLLFMDSCTICRNCKEKKEECKNPRMSRPAPEALAVDVFSTVKLYGFPIEVRTDYSQEMNRYAFLMIE
jgi:predicted metal-binding protein